jgi:two-component system NtrC family response regulator
MAKVLVVSEDEDFVKLISGWMNKDGHEIENINSIQDVTLKIKEESFEFAIVDVSTMDARMRYLFMKSYFQDVSSPQVIIMGEHFNTDYVKDKIIEEGVWDCIKKPETLHGKYISKTVKEVQDRLMKSLMSGLRVHSQKIQLSGFKRDNIIGSSHELLSSLADLAQATASDRPILLTGETGTGKELFANAVHDNSENRKEGQLVEFNCAAIPEDMAESILFGYKKGSHSKADTNKDGLVKRAHNGTLFLDEIGELSLSNQARLLRCIAKKEVLPLGAPEPEKADFRLISATNQDLNRMRQQGKFRDDLYYRISTFVIEIPSLKKHKEDIREIAEYYIKDICKRKNITSIKKPTDAFMRALELSDWPGNVRDLTNVLEKAISRSGDSPILDIYHLPTKIRAEWIAKSAVSQFDLDEKTRKEIFLEAWENIDVEVDSKATPEDSSSPRSITVQINFVPGQIPSYKEVTDASKKEYVRQLDMAVKQKKLSRTEAIEIADFGRSTFYRHKE